MGSDLKLTVAQRRRLLSGSYEPLDFDPDPVRPSMPPCAEGDRYVLGWAPGQPEWVPNHGIRAIRVPVWYITVAAVQRHRKGFWRVRFDVTDNRDPDRFLRRIGGHDPDAPGSYDVLQAGALPDPEWLAVRAKAISERDHKARMDRHDAARRERSQARVRKAA